MSKFNCSKYNEATIRNKSKVEIESRLWVQAFKIVRGKMPYLRKKEVFMMIRQLGPPNVFYAKSVPGSHDFVNIHVAR